MSDVVEQTEQTGAVQADQTGQELSQPLPRVLVYECKNPPLAKYRFMACFQRKAGGTTNRGMLIGHDLNWIGETRDEAEQQAIDWWVRVHTIDPNREAVAGGRGAHLRGKIRMMHRTLRERRFVDPSEEAALAAQGWERGSSFDAPVERVVDRADLPRTGAGRGSGLRGKIRMVNRRLKERRVVDPSEEAALLSQGWERGLKL